MYEDTHPIEEEYVKLDITRSEAEFLSNSFSIGMAWSDDLEFNPRAFIFKVGVAYVALIDITTEVTQPLYCSLSELWMMREFCKTSVKYINDWVGKDLLVRVYKGIQELQGFEDITPPEVELTDNDDLHNIDWLKDEIDGI